MRLCTPWLSPPCFGRAGRPAQQKKSAPSGWTDGPLPAVLRRSCGNSQAESASHGRLQPVRLSRGRVAVQRPQMPVRVRWHPSGALMGFPLRPW